MQIKNHQPKILIVGGGPVGALNAIYFGKSERFQVIVCEKRSDLRLETQVIGRSINLTLSYRGCSALQVVGIDGKILKSAIPIYGRMIHQKNGSLKRIKYSTSDECLFTMNRKIMNELLLTEAEKTKNVQIRFNTKLIDVDFKKKVAKFSTGDEIIDIHFDLIVGSDGAFSTVRHFMSKNMNLDFSQEYIPHGYKELYFPSKGNNSFLMDKNSLHIWPRNEYMLICLPNSDGSFTGTLFMPFKIFESLQTSEKLFKFFQINFPDALELMGKSNLEKMFFLNKPSSMVTIKCNPYNFDDICVIMGDAAHAMVPFYGQGMNCGLEDVLIFHEILKNNDFQIETTCREFTTRRNKDAKAICELAFYNYVELRKDVTSKSFMFRKLIDNLLNSLFPKFWIPLYSMISFTRIPYTKCIEERRKQDKILRVICALGFGFGMCGLLAGMRLYLEYKFKR